MSLLSRFHKPLPVDYADPAAGTYLYQVRLIRRFLVVGPNNAKSVFDELTGPEDVEIVWRKQRKSQNARSPAVTRATAQIIESAKAPLL